MGKYNIGEIWLTSFPFREIKAEKRRPAIVIDDDTIAILAMYVTSQNKENPYSIEITDWKAAGLTVPSWAHIDRIIKMSEWRMISKIGHLSRRDLLKLLQLVSEITTNTFHEFSLIALKNSDNKYLQTYDDRWKCWLFPYLRGHEHNKEYVDSQMSKQFEITVSLSYKAVATHCKYSVSDGAYKIYRHKLYSCLLSDMPDNMKKGEFEINGVLYRWMSISEMEKDSVIMEKNDDVIAFVKTKCE